MVMAIDLLLQGGGMEGRNTRVESDDETVVKHKQSAASPPVGAVLTANSGNGVLPDDRIRQDPKKTNGQVCLTCKYMLSYTSSSFMFCKFPTK